MLSKINDLQGYWRKKIKIWAEAIKRISQIEQNK